MPDGIDPLSAMDFKGQDLDADGIIFIELDDFAAAFYTLAVGHYRPSYASTTLHLAGTQSKITDAVLSLKNSSEISDPEFFIQVESSTLLSLQSKRCNHGQHPVVLLQVTQNGL